MMWRLLVTPDLSGAMNMALDAMLCARVGSGRSAPVLRFYSWRPQCVSLGFHQPDDGVDLAACAAAGIDVVRRPTGGRAVLHAQEFAYAVAAPAGHPDLGRSVSQTYAGLSAWLVCGLAGLGLEVRGSRKDHGNKAGADRVLCFASAGRHEIVVGGRKLVGSAQRRWPEAVLQHGSVLTGRAHQHLAQLLPLPADRRSRLVDVLKTRTGCLSELLLEPPTLSDFAAIMAEAWSATFGCSVAASELSESEWRAARAAAAGYRVGGAGDAAGSAAIAADRTHQLESIP